ncbi:MAG: phosphoglycerate kinase [Polyangiaceae bacterium]
MSNPLEGIKTLADLTLENKRVFLRVDFNVPLDGARITDDARIKEALPSIKHAMSQGARVILASHLGRPKPGKHEGFSLEPCGERLAELLGVEVHMPDDCIGDSAKKVVFDLRSGQLCLLENLRFHEEEEKDDAEFAAKLAALADVYVNDAFGAVHRAHASVHALPRLFQARAAGFLLQKEIAALGQLVAAPPRPYVAILGGAKVSDKLAILEALVEKVDTLLIGGAMANTFLAAKGCNMQASRVEGDKLPLARGILDRAAARGAKVLLPTDVIVAKSLEASEGTRAEVNALAEGQMALDIGPNTIAAYGEAIAKAGSVFWNGPMGLFEKTPFAAGTFGVAKHMADAPGLTVVGGGDSAAAVRAAGPEIADKMKHISTGGGAALEWIEGRKLPGIEALRGGGQNS